MIDQRFKTGALTALSLALLAIVIGPFVVAHAAIIAKVAAVWTLLLVVFVVLWSRGVIRPR